MHPFFLNIGAYLKAYINVLNGAASAEVDGAAIQRVGPGYTYDSGKLIVATGAAAGAPTGISVACKLQDSADGTTFADAKDVNGNVISVTAITAINSQAAVDFNARGLRQYVRAVVTPALTGGTSPTIAVAATVVLGGTNEHPAA